MTEPDRLQLSLRAMESDLHQVRLAGPDAARLRGRQRSRHRAAGIAGGLAILAVAGVLSPLDSYSGTGDAPSPAARLERTPATPPPSPGPAINEHVLLDTSDLTPQDGGWQATDAPWAGQGPFACAPGGADGADETLLVSFAPADEGRVDQVVERYHSAGDAKARFDEIRAGVSECAPRLEAATGGPEFWQLAGVGDAAWVAGYWTPETAGEARRRVEIGVVRTGIAVTHVTWGFLAQDSIEPVVTKVTVVAAEKLCAAAGGACVSQPVLEPDAGASEQAP